VGTFVEVSLVLANLYMCAERHGAQYGEVVLTEGGLEVKAQLHSAHHREREHPDIGVSGKTEHASCVLSSETLKIQQKGCPK
jgi:hypothetical protein